MKCDYTLSEEYRKTHYLPGLLLQELKMALNESKETRRCAINVLRDQFAKHAFDDRYVHKVTVLLTQDQAQITDATCVLTLIYLSFCFMHMLDDYMHAL